MNIYFKSTWLWMKTYTTASCFNEKIRRTPGSQGIPLPMASSGASLHYGQRAGVGDSHGKQHRGTRDESTSFVAPGKMG